MTSRRDRIGLYYNAREFDRVWQAARACDVHIREIIEAAVLAAVEHVEDTYYTNGSENR